MSQTAAATDPYAQSSAAFARARALMPGGVSSPVRAFGAVGRDPVFARSGKGPMLTDVDGREYVDYVGSYGPLVLGHAPDAVLAALSKAAARGTSFGMPTEAETTLAQMVADAVGSIERVRFVNSGTEAAMSAIRLARAATGRDKIIKCIGCYHGHSDGLLVEAGSGAATHGAPSSAGVPASVTQHTLLAPYNDAAAVEKLFEAHPGEVAAMAVEPIAGNMGCVPPAEGYLQRLRELCDRHGALLLFDEVMTGFRVAYGGAQALYGVKPDVTCLGKIVGGGLPCAAYGASEAVMKQVSPDGPMYQAGTLSGNPLAMAAGIATLEALRDPAVYQRLERASAALAKGLSKAAEKARVPVTINRVGSMLSLFFTAEPVTDYASAARAHAGRFAVFFRAMLDAGVNLPPSPFECWFVSAEHDEACIKRTVKAAGKALSAAASVD